MRDVTVSERQLDMVALAPLSGKGNGHAAEHAVEEIEGDSEDEALSASGNGANPNPPQSA
jgi:hypothetical protein